MPVVSEIWTISESKAEGKWPKKLRTEPVKPGDKFFEATQGTTPDGEYLQTVRIDVLSEGISVAVTHSSEKFGPSVQRYTPKGIKMNGYGFSVEGPREGLLGRIKTRRVFKFK